MQASVTGFGFLLGYIVLVGTASFLREIQHEAVESISGELSYGDRDGSYGSARAVDQTRKSRGADKGFNLWARLSAS